MRFGGILAQAGIVALCAGCDFQIATDSSESSANEAANAKTRLTESALVLNSHNLPKPPVQTNPTTTPGSGLTVPIVFVSRQIPANGSIYWTATNDLPGVGPHSRVRPAAPGKLLVLEKNGEVRMLVDGANPTLASLHLIDVNGPAVSYNGLTIVFSGLPDGTYDTTPGASVGAWRLFVINSDGSNLHQLTFSDQDDLSYDQFDAAAAGLMTFDDFDPAFLPDGRICFASTRYPEFAQFGNVRASNLFVVNADGTRLHRITHERNGAERPLVNPNSGNIVYSRWWRNYRYPIDDMTTIAGAPGDVPDYGGDVYLQKDGLGIDPNYAVDGLGAVRNAWHSASINSDGTNLQMWTGHFRNEDDNFSYGGAFAADGTFFSNYFPITNLAEASGFGGIRTFKKGPKGVTPLSGVTAQSTNYLNSNPVSYGIYPGPYAAEPEVLPDGRVLFSRAADINQDYGLYVMNANGTNVQLILDMPGTSELRARVMALRSSPPGTPDAYKSDPNKPFPSRLPPPAEGPYDPDGTFVFKALNVYANGNVDFDIVSAPPVGSAASIRFFIDHQRTSPGSYSEADWPILLGERAINPDGSVTEPNAPANSPLFEQLRGVDPPYLIPLTGGLTPDGSGHVAGLNFGVAGATARCVGCHAGHTQINVPSNDNDAKFSNIATGAAVMVSSTSDPNSLNGLIDRKAKTGPISAYWRSDVGQQTGQWVQLTFPVPVSVRKVRLWNPRFGDEANSSIQVNAATVNLYDDLAATNLVASGGVGTLSVNGTSVDFADVYARVVVVTLDDVTGTFYGDTVAALAEIEVIARGEAP